MISRAITNSDLNQDETATSFSSRSGVDPHPQSLDIAYLSIAELKRRYASGALTLELMVEKLTNRIDTINGGSIELNAIIELDPLLNQNIDAFGDPDERELWGVPVLVKDNIEVAGWNSGAGSLAFGEPALHDAPLITRLRESGALLIGSANMSEWSAASSSDLEEGYSDRGGLTGNPWALDRSAGTSSSGSAAAVAAGLATIAIGTETVGSLAQPASYCGVYAMKATRGLVSNEGIVPYSKSQDSPGVFARSIDDLEIGMSVLAGKRFQMELTPEIRFLMDKDLDDPTQTSRDLRDAYLAFCEALRRGGSESCVMKRTTDGLANEMDTLLLAELNRDLSHYLKNRNGSRWQKLEDAISPQNFPMPPFVEKPLNDRFEAALRAPNIDIESLREQCEVQVIEILEKCLDGSDVLVGISYGPPPKLDMKRKSRSQVGNYMSFLDGLSSFAGWPAIYMPMDFLDGVPVGLALVGRPNCEGGLLGAARGVASRLNTSTIAQPLWVRAGRG